MKDKITKKKQVLHRYKKFVFISRILLFLKEGLTGQKSRMLIYYQ